jgi:signal transduction histidine kinase
MPQSKTNGPAILLWLFFILTGLKTADAVSQITDDDSLERKLQTLPDSAKITYLLNISAQYQHTQITKSLEFAKQALILATSVKDTVQIGTVNLKIAELYLYKGVYDKSLAFLLEALKLFEKTGWEKEIAYCCEIIGKVYKAINNPQKAAEYYNKAITTNLKLNQISDVARNYTSLGSVFVDMDSIDKGLSYYLVSFMIIDSLGMEPEKNELMIQLGDGYFSLGKYEESLKNYYQAMELAEKKGNLFLLAQAKSRIGITYFRMNNLPAAMKYSKQSLWLTKDLKTFRIAGESYRNLAEIYAAQQDYKKAYESYIHYKEVSDSLLNEERLRQIGELQVKYDIAQKEKENEFLKQQNLHKSKTIHRITIAVIIIVILLILSLIQLMILVRLNKKTRHLNLKLEEQSKELEELNDQKDKFFSFVAHNLKNPFTTILGFSELMVKNSDAKDYKKMARHAEHILGLSIHVHKILNNLLEWSRIHRRRYEYNPERTDITGLIRDILEMNDKEAARKGIELSDELPENLTAYADKFMVTIILQNLMSNALNFTHSSGKIKISGKKDGSQVIITVADTGIGIAAEDLPKLFRIDVQPEIPGTAESKGAGLGLVICKEMVQRLRGEITIESKLNHGTSVTFTLPVSNGNTQDQENKEMPQHDFVQEMKEDMKNAGKLPESFIDICTSSLLPTYNEVRSVLSLENLSDFAREVEDTGHKYNITSFIHYGHHLSALIQTHQVDKILRILPEFKKMVETFVT